MKLSECTIENISEFARWPISWSSSWLFGKRNEKITITVAHRLAHLISRLETRADRQTAIGAKWYLDNLNLLQQYQLLWNVIEPFADRLGEDVDNFQERYGVVDPAYLNRLIELAGYTKERLLVGPEIDFITGPCFGSPARNLSRFISCHLWRQGLWD
jgi:hypothetical protein